MAHDPVPCVIQVATLSSCLLIVYDSSLAYLTGPSTTRFNDTSSLYPLRKTLFLIASLPYLKYIASYMFLTAQLPDICFMIFALLILYLMRSHYFNAHVQFVQANKLTYHALASSVRS